MKIGNVVAKLRTKRGLTQDQMADFLGVKRARYNAWENDISKPDIEMLKRIAEFHKVSTDYILGIPESNVITKDLKEIIDYEDISFNGASLSKEDKDKIKRIIETIIMK